MVRQNMIQYINILFESGAGAVLCRSEIIMRKTKIWVDISEGKAVR